MHGLPFAPTIAEASDLIEQWGAKPFDIAPHLDWFLDEHVDAKLVVASFTFVDPVALREHATEEEQQVFVRDPDDVFDPLEYGSDQEELTTLAHEIETLDRIVVTLERASDDPARVGGFRVWGAGQWLRERLWAVTGVVPRDPGSVDRSSQLAPLFGRAFSEVGRAPFTNDPMPHSQPRP